MAQERFAWATLDDKRQIEAIPAEQRWPGGTVYQMLAGTAARHPSRPAVSFQLKGGPADPAETLDWTALKAQVTQAANLFRSLGVGDGDAVAYVLPNATDRKSVV